MFGYIKPHIPLLRVCDYELYKSVYCGFCRSLSKEYGPLARFTLSYDFAFITMLSMAVNDTAPEIAPKRCPFVPTKVKPHLMINKDLTRCTNLAMIMLYFKCMDNKEDGMIASKPFWYTTEKLSSISAFKAKESEPEGFEIIKKATEAQREVEKTSAGLDEAAHFSAEALGKLFSHLAQDTFNKKIMYRLGFMLGRFVYLCDAIDDLEKDKNQGKFNPLTNEYDISYLENTLYLTISEITLAYQLLDIKHFKEILDNIIYYGLPETANTIIKK